jgi:hypothetical protein
MNTDETSLLNSSYADLYVIYRKIEKRKEEYLKEEK